MPRLKLTSARVAKLKAGTGTAIFYWDIATPGFGVRCNATGQTKTYVVQALVRGIGKTRRKNVGRTDVCDLEDARNEALLMMRNMNMGIDPSKKDKASEAEVFTVWDAWLYYERHSKAREVTKRGYKQVIENWLGKGPDYMPRKLDSWLDRPIASITRDEVLDRHMLIQELIANKSTSELVTGMTTANGVMRVLRLLHNEADRKFDTLPKNPVRMKGKWFGSHERTTFVEDPDKPDFYEAVMKLENVVQRDAILFMLFSGLRVSTTCALRWNQVDLEQGNFTLSVADQKGKFEQTLPLGSFLHEKLIARRSIGNPGGWVFPANRSKTGHLTDPKRGAWGFIEEQTGKHYMNHDLRRTWASVLAEVAPNQVIFDYLTHHKPQRVADKYAMLKPDRLRPVVQSATDTMIKMCNIQEIAGENIVSL